MDEKYSSAVVCQDGFLCLLIVAASVKIMNIFTLRIKEF